MSAISRVARREREEPDRREQVLLNFLHPL
jgi:hypothetical protein